MGYIYQTLTKQAAMDFPGYYWWGERFGRLAALRNPATPRGRILNETSHHSPASLQNYLTRLLSSANAGQANIYEGEFCDMLIPQRQIYTVEIALHHPETSFV